MRIDRFVTTPDRAGRYRVELEDGRVLRLYRQTVEDFALYSGMEMTDEELTKLLSAASAMSAKMRAVRIVSASSVSKRDLQQRLVQKGEDPKQAEAAVAWMEELSLIDDSKTAQQIVQRCIAKGYGVERAKQALYEKKIPKSYWQNALEDYPDQEDSVLTFLRSRLDEDSDAKEVKKAVDALLRRGHHYSVIKKALEKLSCDSEEFSEV